MPLDLQNYQQQAKEAIKAFWGNRHAALVQQAKREKLDSGTRGAVTAGKNLNGFINLIQNLVTANGLPDADVHVSKGLVVLPGYFRPTKQWDLLVMHNKRLIAALEFKSQVGSFGNNYNNRTEEAIGTAHCLWTAYREGALGDQPRPFLGWLMVVEDAAGSRKKVRNDEPHFKVSEDFKNSSYLDRYDLLCKKLVKEQLYSAATVLATPSSAIESGTYTELSVLSGLDNFVTSFAGHIAAEAARALTTEP